MDPEVRQKTAFFKVEGELLNQHGQEVLHGPENVFSHSASYNER